MSSFVTSFYRIFIFLFISSCTVTNPRYIDSPSVSAPEYLEKKGDAKISGNIALSSGTHSDIGSNDESYETIGFDLKASYAISNRFMIVAGGFFRNEKDFFNSNDVLQTHSRSKIVYERKALDLGFGAIIPLSDKGFFYPIIGGYFGKAKINLSNYSDTINDNTIYYLKGNYSKLYLKPTISFHLSPNFKTSCYLQLATMKYYNLSSNYPTEPLDILELTDLGKLGAKHHTILEPGLFTQIGLNKVDWLKFDLGFALSFHIFKGDGYSNLRTRKIQLSAGISISPSEMYLFGKK